jgi:hypothetical protein
VPADPGPRADRRAWPTGSDTVRQAVSRLVFGWRHRGVRGRPHLRDRVTEQRRERSAAQIGWYLLVEPDLSNFESMALRLFRLEGRHYVEHATVPFGATLNFDGPLRCAIDTHTLLGW